jgi:hypothetical protein
VLTQRPTHTRILFTVPSTCLMRTPTPRFCCARLHTHEWVGLLHHPSPFGTGTCPGLRLAVVWLGSGRSRTFNRNMPEQLFWSATPRRAVAATPKFGIFIVVAVPCRPRVEMRRFARAIKKRCGDVAICVRIRRLVTDSRSLFALLKVAVGAPGA